jgi:cysteine desulfurase family protein
VNRNRSVYLDNAATTYPKPEEVYREIDRFMREVGGSAGRSGHWRALETGRMVYAARASIARLFNVGDPLRIVFTKNATEAINAAIWGILKPGDHVVTTSIEHNSVMRPLEAAREVGISYTVAQCRPDATLDPSRVDEAILPETALVIINHASNVTGTILPVGDIAELARSRGVRLMVDAAQTAGRMPIDVEANGIDLLAFTGHKELFGPQGIGGLYVREGLEIEPIIYGGTGSRSSSLEQPLEMPDRCESGTLNAPGIAGLAAGIEFVESTGVETIMRHERGLVGRMLEGLARMRGTRILGPQGPEGRVGIVALTFDSQTPPSAAEILDRRYGISCRAGLHCAPMAHRTIGTFDSGALRIGFSHMNTPDQVDYLLECLEEMTRG